LDRRLTTEHEGSPDPGPAVAAEPPPSDARPARRAVLLRPLLGLLGGQLAGGVLVGVIWRLWAPSTVAFVAAGPDGRTVLIPAESESQFAGDGRFALLAAVVGALAGALAWRLRTGRGPWLPALLASGALLSALVGRAVGELLAAGEPARIPQTIISPPLVLHSAPVLFVQAFVAVLVYTMLVGLSSDARPRDPDR
jgi:hypothetical protein